MADTHCTDRPTVGDYWLTELESVCDALGFMAHQVCAQQGHPGHLVNVASTLHVLHAYLRIQLGTAPEEARGEVRHG
jgi:hypothetical protein